MVAYGLTLVVLGICAWLKVPDAVLEHLSQAIELGLPVLLAAEGGRNWQEAKVKSQQ